MAIPDYQTIMLPVLQVIGAHPDRAISMAELKAAIAETFELSEEDLNQELPSGTQTTFANRLSWACVYMKKAGLLSAPRRAHLQITTRGQEVLALKPERINGAFLRQFPEFVAFQSAKAQKAAPTHAEKNDENGIIKEDRLGLDTIYLQAKRWTDKPVGRPDVQQFAGALAGHGVTKGIFITTSEFTKDARDYASGLRNVKLVLIDGEDLAGRMIDHNLGVATTATYEVKRIDSDYFAEGE